ncbi:hypothetical protein, partial [Bradyrhizobium sp. Arg816]|uniref:hypothetical protein n=1 Tax=Bradyrhizobium sp. Arg816 TaxID=2998491 RepID=UPI00249EFAF9
MKFVSALCATALSLVGVTPASTQTYPPSPGTFVFKGPTTITNGLTLNCILTVNVYVTSSSTAVATPSI